LLISPPLVAAFLQREALFAPTPLLGLGLIMMA